MYLLRNIVRYSFRPVLFVSYLPVSLHGFKDVKNIIKYRSLHICTSFSFFSLPKFLVKPMLAVLQIKMKKEEMENFQLILWKKLLE